MLRVAYFFFRQPFKYSVESKNKKKKGGEEKRTNAKHLEPCRFEQKLLIIILEICKVIWNFFKYGERRIKTGLKDHSKKKTHAR